MTRSHSVPNDWIPVLLRHPTLALHGGIETERALEMLAVVAALILALSVL